MTTEALLYLDDLLVGQSFHSGEYHVGQNEILDFAKQYDPQPFHLDDAAARNTFFQGLAASGWLTAAITMRLITQSVPLGCGIIGAGGELEWKRPTRPGDTLRVTSTIMDIKPSRSKPDRGMVTAECLTLNQDKEVCQRFVTKLVVMRRPE